MPRSIVTLVTAWRTEAERLDRFAAAGAATAFRDAALQLESALRAEEGELLTLAESALVSGHSVDHLRHLVSAGTIANAGRKGKPMIRRADLPKKATRTLSGYDVDADARHLQRSIGGAR